MERVLRNVNGSHPRTLEAQIAAPLSALDGSNVRLDYWRRDELAIVDGCIDPWVLAKLRAEVHALSARVKRRAVWGYKAAGSLSCHALSQGAPTVMTLYRSPALLAFLSDLAERRLQTCPEADAHAAAVYWYEHAGDRVGFHYDVSHYRGARYTALIGLEDDSSGRLQCQLRARERRPELRWLEVKTDPGKLVFFNGDKLLHAVSPIAAGERRIVLSLQYVTDVRMRPSRRALSTIKDSFAYFGLDALLPYVPSGWRTTGP